MLKVGILLRSVGVRYEAATTPKCFFSIDGPTIKKAPLTPYMRFSNNERSQVVAENPGLHITEVAKIIGVRWKALPDAEKKALSREYKREKEDYTASLTEEDVKLINSVKAQKKAKKEKRIVKKVHAETDKPKRPLTAFILFSQTISRGDLSLTEHTIEVGKKWRALNDSEKQRYSDEHKRLKSQYDVDMQTWCVKMVEAGKSKFVSQPLLDEVFGKPQFPGREPVRLFLKENSGTETVDKEMRESLMKEWAELSDKQKSEYTRRWEKAASRYPVDLKEWKAKIKADGFGEIIEKSKKTKSEKTKKTSKADKKGKEE